MAGASMTSFLIMIVSFIVAIAILVSVHEYGHFWMARRVGIRVLKFSIGFGKPIWSRKSPKDGVEYIIASIPMGGYVKLLDEREGNVAPQDLPYAYNRAPVWKRILTLLAGPFANLLFAIAAYWVLLMIGIPGIKPVVGAVEPESIAARAGLKQGDLVLRVQGEEEATQGGATVAIFNHIVDGAIRLDVRDEKGGEREVMLRVGDDRRDLTEPQGMMTGLGFEFWSLRLPAIIDKVAPGGSAETAGLKSGDRVLQLDDVAISDFNQLATLIRTRMNSEVTLHIERDGSRMTVPVRIAEETVDGRSVGRIGVQPKLEASVPEALRATQKFGPLAALGGAVEQTWKTCTLSLKVMWNIVLGKVSTKNLSGPISIAEYTGVAARQGLMAFVNFLALISISIGIFNLLPIPMLDGGQIVYQLVEWIKGSPISERFQLISQQVGVAMLLMLFSLALYNDIARHLS